MTKRHFGELIAAKWAEGKFVCVGLDVKKANFPDNEDNQPVLNFIKKIVDQTHDAVCAYKPNFGFYLPFGPRGIQILRNAVAYIHNVAPDVPVILDGKFGDIGNTNEEYADFAFKYLRADAMTASGYPGLEALKPFFAYEDKGIFVLCKTSNPGSDEFQDFSERSGRPLYLKLLQNLADKRNKLGNCGVVAGATYPAELESIRRAAPTLPLLIPGIGKQGGDLEKVVRAAKRRFIINSSSNILNADDPKLRTLELHNKIQALLH